MNKQEEEAILKQIVEQKLDIKGGYKKPSKFDNDKGESAGTSAPAQHLDTCSAPRHLFSTSTPVQHLRHLLSTYSTFHYEYLRHLQHLQPISHYLKWFSQHLAIKLKAQNLGIIFYHKVLGKPLKIAQNWLGVL